MSWPAESATQKVRYRQRFYRLVSKEVIAGLPVLACSTLDPTCATPLDEKKSDENGDVIMDLPLGFRGYLQMPNGGPSFPSMLPHIMAVVPPPAADFNLDATLDYANSWSLVSADELNALLATVGASLDPESGHINAQTFDCSRKPLAGATVRATPTGAKTLEYYFQGEAPNTSATRTDSSGLLGFINVPPGVTTLDTEHPDRALSVGSFAVLLKKGTVTLVELHPTPR